jgi:hypothetical protein
MPLGSLYAGLLTQSITIRRERRKEKALSYTGSNGKWLCQVSIMYYLATKSIIKLLYDRNDLLRYAIVFQNFSQYLMAYAIEGFFSNL